MGVLDKIKPKAELVDFHNDDIQVLRSWVEYSRDRSTMQYLLYEMEILDKDGGRRRFFKAIKFLRIIRLPKDAKQELKFMEMTSQLLSGLYTRDINWLVIMANIIHPVALGLLHCYGVQGVADDVDEARRLADNDFAALEAGMQGTFRVMEFRALNYDEVEWLREKMYGMKHLTVVRGIPQARRSAAEGERIGWGQMTSGGGAEGTAEDFVAGMSGREFILMAVASSVRQNTLNAWRAQIAKDFTFWSGQHQGTRSVSAGISMPFMFAANLGSNSGWTHSTTDMHGTTHSLADSFSTTVGHSNSQSTSIGENVGQSVGQSATFTHSASMSHSDGTSATITNGYTAGVSHGVTNTAGTSQSTGITQSFGTSHSISHGTSVTQGQTIGASGSSSVSQSHGATSSGSQSYGMSASSNTGNGGSMTEGHSSGSGLSISGGPVLVKAGATNTQTDTNSNGVNFTSSHGQSATDSVGVSNGTTDSVSGSSSRGFSASSSVSQGSTTTETSGTSSSTSISSSSGTSNSTSISNSQSFSASHSISQGVTSSNSYGEGISRADGSTMSQSQGASAGQSTGTTQSESQSTGRTTSNGTTDMQGIGSGTTGGLTQGTSASGGVGPSISFGKSYQWVDQEVTQIMQLLEYQSNRLMLALSGQGAFFMDVMIGTPDEPTKAAAQTLARTAWVNEKAYVTPLEVLDLSEEEESHLLYHFNAFSPCNARESFGEITSYRYSTVLLANEAVAYSHPLRISEGGIFADVESIPILAVPSMRSGPVYMGKIVSGERWTPTMGYKTPFDFRLEEGELMHSLIAGESRSGKTESALRYVAEVANKVRIKNGKRYRILALDPKRDWRRLARFVDPERFKFYSLANLDMHPIRLNLCKIPKGVFPQFYLDGLVEVYCRAYQLNERGREILTDALSYLYDEEGVFEANWRDVAPERSARVSMTRLYERVKQMKVDLEDPSKGFGKAGNADREALGRVLERLKVFSRPYTIESQLFGQVTDMGIDDLLGQDDVVVLESYGLEGTFRNFVFGLITNGIFQYAQGHPNGFLSDDQYPTMVVIEEANEVLVGSGGGGGQQVGLPGTSAFEKILDQSAGLGLLITSITQKPADMPPSVFANAGLIFAGKLSRKEDLELIVLKLGRDPRRQDIELLKWFPRSPIGWLVCRSSRNFDFKQIEPSLVSVDKLDVDNPSDTELKAILEQANVLRGMKMVS